jgi:hypothetical protein
MLQVPVPPRARSDLEGQRRLDGSHGGQRAFSHECVESDYVGKGAKVLRIATYFEEILEILPGQGA